MVKVTDDGVFDAPLDKLWKYVGDGMMHQHKSFKVNKVTPKSANVMLWDLDVANPGGKGWHKETLQFTFNPPKGFAVEYLAGPWKGSKHSHTYTPMGNKTRVDVAGDFHIEGLDDAATKKAVLANFAEAFSEDSLALQKYK